MAKRHPLLADRTETMNPSAIRELLKSLNVPGMISGAGGFPAADSFPVEVIRGLIDKVLREKGAAVLQYGITEGYPPLRAALAEYVRERGICCSPEEVCVSTGAQTAIDAASKILLDPGDCMAVEAPTFLAALNVFRAYQARIIAVESDEEGAIPEDLERVLDAYPIKFTYLIPTFQNPTGRTLSRRRREKVAEILVRRGALAVEDDPYYELRYRGEALPTLKSFAPDNVIYLGSLSKVFSPGMRLGYYIAPPPFQEFMTTSRQAVDVHAGHLAQAAADEYIRGGHLKACLPSIVELYRSRLETMLKTLDDCLPEGFARSNPDGGMFVWISGPAGFDAVKAQREALSKKVAFVPGGAFFADASRGGNTLRLNFTLVPEDKIREGLAILAEALASAL